MLSPTQRLTKTPGRSQMQLLALGMGKWDGSIVRVSNPMVRQNPFSYEHY